MTARYFVPELPHGGGAVELPEPEAHHARSVMRVQTGQSLVLFDGRGYQAAATVRSVWRRGVNCEATAAVFLPRRNPRPVTLAVAMPKGDRSKELVERLTELGIDAMVPIQCERSPWSVSPGNLEKWRRVMIEACKQSGRNTLMEILPPCPLGDYLTRQTRGGADSERWIAHPGGVPPRAFAATGDGDRSGAAAALIAVGPEGGFTDEEIATAAGGGWTTVGLGERIYRIETAAIILAIKAAGI